MCAHLDRAGDAAELGTVQQDEAGGGVELLEPAAVEHAVLSGQAERPTSAAILQLG